MSSSASTQSVRFERMVEAHELLAGVSRSLGPALELRTTVTHVLQAMRSLVEFRGGSICVVENGLVRILAADPSPSPEVMDARLPVGDGLAGRVVAGREVVYSPDLDGDPRVDSSLRRLGSNAGMTSWLGVPLICLGRVIGLLQVDSPTVDAFDEVDRTLLAGLGAQVANAIESARQIEEMHRLERQQQAFLQMVGHELRTPLTIAKGFVESVVDAGGDVDPETLTLTMQRTHRAMLRLEGLVEELILTSELVGGDVRPQWEPIRLRPLLDRVAARSVLPTRVTVDCPDDEVLCTDPKLAELAVAAVVDNALKYAGDAAVVVRRGRIEVHDHGGGIPADVAGRERDRFTRSEADALRTAGLGLGLSMASSIIELLGGDLTVTGATSGGTLVLIDFEPAPPRR